MIDPTKLPDNFYLAAAIGVQPMEEILAMYEISEEDAEELQANPTFTQRLLLAKDAVETDGTAFFARCRILAGQTMPAMVNLINDSATPASVQLEAWKTLVKFGRLEPQPKEAIAGPTGPQLTLTIIAPNGETAFSTALTSNQPPLKQIPGAVVDDDPPPLPVYPEEDDDWVDPPDLPVRKTSAAALGFAL